LAAPAHRERNDVTNLCRNRQFELLPTRPHWLGGALQRRMCPNSPCGMGHHDPRPHRRPGKFPTVPRRQDTRAPLMRFRPLQRSLDAHRFAWSNQFHAHPASAFIAFRAIALAVLTMPALLQSIRPSGRFPRVGRATATNPVFSAADPSSGASMSPQVCCGLATQPAHPGRMIVPSGGAHGVSYPSQLWSCPAVPRRLRLCQPACRFVSAAPPFSRRIPAP